MADTARRQQPLSANSSSPRRATPRRAVRDGSMSNATPQQSPVQQPPPSAAQSSGSGSGSGSSSGHGQPAPDEGPRCAHGAHSYGVHACASALSQPLNSFALHRAAAGPAFCQLLLDTGVLYALRAGERAILRRSNKPTGGGGTRALPSAPPHPQSSIILCATLAPRVPQAKGTLDAARAVASASNTQLAAEGKLARLWPPAARAHQRSPTSSPARARQPGALRLRHHHMLRAAVRDWCAACRAVSGGATCARGRPH